MIFKNNILKIFISTTMSVFSGHHEFVCNGFSCVVDNADDETAVFSISNTPVANPSLCENHTGTDIFECHICGEDWDVGSKRYVMNWALNTLAHTTQLYESSYDDFICTYNLGNDDIFDELIRLLAKRGYTFVSTEEHLQELDACNGKAVYYSNARNGSPCLKDAWRPQMLIVRHV